MLCSLFCSIKSFVASSAFPIFSRPLIKNGFLSSFILQKVLSIHTSKKTSLSLLVCGFIWLGFRVWLYYGKWLSFEGYDCAFAHVGYMAKLIVCKDNEKRQVQNGLHSRLVRTNGVKNGTNFSASSTNGITIL